MVDALIGSGALREATSRSKVNGGVTEFMEGPGEEVVRHIVNNGRGSRRGGVGLRHGDNANAKGEDDEGEPALRTQMSAEKFDAEKGSNEDLENC